MTDDIGPYGPGYVSVPLKNGGHAIIDEESIPIVAPYIWRRVDFLQGSRIRSYAVASTRRGKVYTCIQMHRLIYGLGIEDRIHVDHRNHDGLDNRRENLRLATPKQNAANKRKQLNSASRYKGVARSGTAPTKWMATIEYRRPEGRKTLCLGLFDLENEAAFAYRTAGLLVCDPKFFHCPIPESEMPSEERQEEIRQVVTEKFMALVAGRKTRTWASSVYRCVHTQGKTGRWTMMCRKHGTLFTSSGYANEHEAAFAYNALMVRLGKQGPFNIIVPANMPDEERQAEITEAVKIMTAERLAGKNRSQSDPITAFGESKGIKAWGRDPRCVVSRTTLRLRLTKGWKPETAMTTPA
jgi:hypothetical protein